MSNVISQFVLYMYLARISKSIRVLLFDGDGDV